MDGPHSSYSCLEIHICWKVEREARMDPPIQTEYFLSGGAMILILMVEGGERSKDGSSNPDRVLPLWWSNDLDLDGGRSKCGDFLLHTVSNTRVHGGASRHDSVGIEILTDVNIAL